jgi:hypothetical protein
VSESILNKLILTFAYQPYNADEPSSIREMTDVYLLEYQEQAVHHWL